MVFGFKYKEKLNGSLYDRSVDAYREQADELDQQATKFPAPTFMTKGVGMMVVEGMVGEQITEAVGQDLYDALRSGYFLTLSEEWKSLDVGRGRALAQAMSAEAEDEARREHPAVTFDDAQKFFLTLLAPVANEGDGASHEYVQYWQQLPGWQRMDSLPEHRAPMTELFAKHMLKLDPESTKVFMEASDIAWTTGRWIGTFDMLDLIPDKR